MPQQKPPMQTPAEFSRLRQERDAKMAEKREEMRQQYMAAQRVYYPVAKMIRYSKY